MPNIQTYLEDTINLITIGYKQDPESHSIIYKMSRIWSKIIGIQKTKIKQNSTHMGKDDL